VDGRALSSRSQKERKSKYELKYIDKAGNQTEGNWSTVTCSTHVYWWSNAIPKATNHLSITCENSTHLHPTHSQFRYSPYAGESIEYSKNR